MKQKVRVLELVSWFPKATHKGFAGFLRPLMTSLTPRLDVVVLAPKENASEPDCDYGEFPVYKHKQFFCGSPQLAYGSGMLPNLRRNRLLYFVLPVFICYQFLAVRKVLRREKISIVHAHWLMPQGFVAALYKKVVNPEIQVLVTSHGSDLNLLNSWPLSCIKKFVLSAADYVTVVSEPLQQKARQLGCRKEISVIPVGIDPQTFCPTPGPEVWKTPHTRQLLFVGRLVEVKGIMTLFQAMPAILQLYSQTSLTVIGDGNLREQLENFARQHGISKHIHFTGTLANASLPAYYSQADLVIMPSLHEGSPVVLPEALACGALVLASDIPAYRQHIHDGQNGFLFTCADPSDLAEKVIYILDHDAEVQSLKLRSRQYIVEHFDWNVIGQKYSTLITTMVQQPHSVGSA